MTNYNSTVEVPIAFMKDCIKNEYYDNTSKHKTATKSAFFNFEQRNDYDDFDELERQLLDN